MLSRRHEASIVSDDWVKGSSRSIPNCTFTTKRWGTRPETKYYGFWVIIFWLLTFLIPFLPFQHLWSYDLLVLCKSVIASHRCELFFETHTHTRLTALCPGLPGWSGTRKAKPIWILLKQETVSGNGISWAICKSAPRSRQITTPAPHRSVFFTGRMPFLPPNQQCQSTEGDIPTNSNSQQLERSKILWLDALSIAMPAIATGKGRAFSCLFLCALKEKRLELSKPK